MRPVGQIRYVHTVPAVLKGDPINLPLDDRGLEALALTPVGVVALPAWTYDHVTPAMWAAAAGLGALGQLTTTIDDDRYNPGRKVRVMNIGTADEPNIMRQATLSAASDGETCPTDGPHAHHDSTTLDRNRGGGRGFPDPRGALGAFCSDTWMYKFQSAGTAAASTVAACPTIVAPSGLVAADGDGRLTLTWSAPTLPTNPGYAITGYEVRHKLDSASDWPETWTAVSGTSHVLTGLANGTTYDIQLRAVSDRHLRSAPIAASGTPRTRLLPTPTASPTDCTVRVRIEDAGGSLLNVAGVGVTGGGPGDCGDRELAVALTNLNYSFTGWSAAGCGGTPVPQTCTVTTGPGATTVHVTATFTRKQCTVSANVQTLDTDGTVSAAVGGSVRANGTASSSATVPCGETVDAGGHGERRLQLPALDARPLRRPRQPLHGDHERGKRGAARLPRRGLHDGGLPGEHAAPARGLYGDGPGRATRLSAG